MPTIKRYSNRKLYDTESRRYVTLDDISDMIRRSEEVEIIDHETGADLTAIIMAQIIFEQEKKLGGLLPRIMLTHLVQAGGNTLRDLTDSVKAFIYPEQHVEDDIRRRVQALIDYGKVTAEEGIQLLEMFLDPSLKPKTPPEPPAAPADDGVTREELQSLIRKLEALEKQIETIKNE